MIKVQVIGKEQASKSFEPPVGYVLKEAKRLDNGDLQITWESIVKKEVLLG